MKILKNIFLLLALLAFSISLLFSQLNIASKSTLLSTNYFNKMLDETRMSEVLVKSIELPDSKSLYEESWEDSELEPLNAALIESIDKNWLEQQALILLKGTHSYVFGNSDRLPVLDLSELKKNFQQRVLADYSRVTKNASEQEKAEGLKTLNQRIKFDNIKENFDLNELVVKLYSNRANPLSALRDLVYSYSKTFVILLSFLPVLFLLIILVISYKIKPALVWIGVGTLFSGVLGFLSGMLASRINMAEIILGLDSAIKNVTAKTIIDYFMRVFFNILLIEGAILILLGTTLIISGVVSLRKKIKVTNKIPGLNNSITDNESPMTLKRDEVKNQIVKSNYKHQIIFRVVAVIILAFTISMFVLLETNSFKVSITKFSESLDFTSKLVDDHDFAEATIQVSGAEFINEKFDPSNAIQDSTKGYLAGILVEVLDVNGEPVRRVDLVIHKDKPNGPKLVIFGLVTQSNGKVNKFSLPQGTYYIEVLNNGKVPKNLKLPKKMTKVVVSGAEDIDVRINLENK